MAQTFALASYSCLPASLPSPRVIIISMTNDKKPFVTILSKNGLFSFLGLIETDVEEAIDLDEEEQEMAQANAIVKLDPREEHAVVKQFSSRTGAIRAYQEAVSTSLDRGWSLVYKGNPLAG